MKLLKLIDQKIEQKEELNMVKKHIKTTKEKKGGIVQKKTLYISQILQYLMKKRKLKKDKQNIKK